MATNGGYAALLVRDGKIERVAIENRGGGDSGSRHTHELIGGFFSSCFTIHVGNSRAIRGMCDDDFLAKPDLPWNVVLDPSLYHAGGHAIRGPIVIKAYNGPNTASMTEAEMAMFQMVGTAQLMVAVDGGGDLVVVPILGLRR